MSMGIQIRGQAFALAIAVQWYPALRWGDIIAALGLAVLGLAVSAGLLPWSGPAVGLLPALLGALAGLGFAAGLLVNELEQPDGQ